MKVLKFMLGIALVMYLCFSASNLTFNYLKWEAESRLLCSVFTSVIFFGYLMLVEINKQTK